MTDDMGITLTNEATIHLIGLHKTIERQERERLVDWLRSRAQRLVAAAEKNEEGSKQYFVLKGGAAVLENAANDIEDGRIP